MTRIRVGGFVVGAAALVWLAPMGASASGDAGDKLRHALSKAGFTEAQSQAIRRDPGRLFRYLETRVAVREEPLTGAQAQAAGYPRRGCHTRTTTTKLHKGFTWAWYRVSLRWCWNKRTKRVETDTASIDDDYDISTAAAAAGLRHASHGITKSGYYRWKGSRRGGYLVEGELSVHMCPVIEIACSPEQTLHALVAGHWDGTVTRKGWGDSH
jgi:hypothetical protein